MSSRLPATRDGDTESPRECLATGGRGGAIPGADVVPSSQPERVPHRRTQLCQLAVLLTPKEALPETTVSLSLKDNNQTTHAIFKK